MNIDVTMVAMLRLTVFKKTIESFFENMFKDFIDQGNTVTLILNIDEVGNEGSSSDIINCASKYFNNFIINTEVVGCFPKAFKTVWMRSLWNYNHSESNSPIFHLEDDWELLKKINLLKLIKILEEEKDLALIRLPAFHAGTTSMKNWNKFFPYNGKYYECPEEMKGGLGFCGHPSLIQKQFIQNTARFLDENRNPEKQFHSRGRTPIMKEVMKWRYSVYGIPGTPPLIRDIGRKWMVRKGYRKQGVKAHFVNWEKVEGE